MSETRRTFVAYAHNGGTFGGFGNIEIIGPPPTSWEHVRRIAELIGERRDISADNIAVLSWQPLAPVDDDLGGSVCD